MTKNLHSFFTYSWLICFPAVLLTNRFIFSQPAEDPVHSQFLHGYTQSPAGDEDCNPCLEDVIQAVNTLRNRGETMGFNWGGDHPPIKGAGSKSHWQGIQRLRAAGLDFPYLVAASSHGERVLSPSGRFEVIGHPARFAIVEMGSRDNDGFRLRSNRLARGRLTRDVSPHPLDRIVKSQVITTDYYHPGGIQTIGNFVLVGADGNIDHWRNTSLFTLWDFSDPLSPKNIWDQPLWELRERNANSVGITKLQDGRYLMLRALTDAKQLEFYILNDNLHENPAAYLDGTPWDRWDYGELRSELYNPDGSLDQAWADIGHFLLPDAGYQSTDLVTECGTGNIYLIAAHGRRPESIGGEDYVDAFRIDVPVEQPDPDAKGEGAIITKVAKRRMFPVDNAETRQADLQAASGIYVSADNKLYFYATEHGTVESGEFVRMIEFGPEEPRSEVHSLQEAWARLYALENFDGRSITLDYVDRDARDYNDFANIENFDDTASSLMYAIPAGYSLRLYAEKFRQGSYLDLKGSGGVNRIANLDSILLSNGDTADNQISSAEWPGVLTMADGTQNPSLTFQLHQNFPNPFNPETVINYQIPYSGAVKIEIYDIRGHVIKTLVNESQAAGFYSKTWNGTTDLGQEAASGTYFYKLELDDLVKVKKLTILR